MAAHYRFTTLLILALAWSQPSTAAQLLLFQEADNQSTTPPPILSNGASPADREVADDFTLTGIVQRIEVGGHDCFNCAGALSSGVTLRIYEKLPSGLPGAVLREHHFAADDPAFVHDVNRTGHDATLDITLPEGFAADGSYFLSVQLEYPDDGYWAIWSSRSNDPSGTRYLVRDNLAASGWAPATGAFANSDVAFRLYGVRPGPPPPRLVANCGEWSEQEVPLPAGAEHARLESIKAFGQEEMWAVGSYDRTVDGTFQSFSLAYHHANGAWSIVPTPSPAECSTCTQVFLTAVDGLAPDDVWATGWKRARTQDGFLGGQVFVIHFNGTSWSEVPAPVTNGGSGAWGRGIRIHAPNDLWIVGDWVGATPWNAGSASALAMHWNGSAFSLVQTPYPAFGTPGWSLDAVAGPRDDLWAVGGGSDGDPAASTYFVHWNGSQWQLAQPAMPGLDKRFSHVLALPGTTFAGGEGFTVADGYFGIVARRTGDAWSHEDTGGGGGGPMVSFAPDSVLALGGTNVYWNGSTWQPQPSLTDVTGSLADIDQTGACNATAVGMKWVADARRPLVATIAPIVFDTDFE